MKESLWVFLLVSEPKFDRSSVRRFDYGWIVSVSAANAFLPGVFLSHSPSLVHLSV